MSEKVLLTIIVGGIVLGVVALANWRAIEVARLETEAIKIQAEQGKKFKFGTTKEE